MTLRSLQGSGEPCAICGESCDGFAGDPGLWPVAICRKGDAGIPKWYHSGCIGKQLDAVAELEAALDELNTEIAERHYKGLP